jgi:hypothetical protein
MGKKTVFFLPPNVTQLCQPMDQRVVQILKQNYRRRLFQPLMEDIDKREEILENFKKTNLGNDY